MVNEFSAIHEQAVRLMKFSTKYGKKNPNEKLDSRFDRDIRKAEIKYRREHGPMELSDLGLQRRYYFCDKCKVGWSSTPPYKVIHYAYYAIPRRIKGWMPACPKCRRREDVRNLNRYKKANKDKGSDL